VDGTGNYLLLLSEWPGVGAWGQLIKHAWGFFGYGIHKYIPILNVSGTLVHVAP
jgi:hypothetical protein